MISPLNDTVQKLRPHLRVMRAFYVAVGQPVSVRLFLFILLFLRLR